MCRGRERARKKKKERERTGYKLGFDQRRKKKKKREAGGRRAVCGVIGPRVRRLICLEARASGSVAGMG